MLLSTVLLNPAYSCAKPRSLYFKGTSPTAYLWCDATGNVSQGWEEETSVTEGAKGGGERMGEQ